MTIGEYYNFPSGIEPKMKYMPHWLEENPNFPCLADMSYAFAYNKLSKIPPIDTSNVTNMSYMLYECTSLTSVDSMKDWDTSKVTNMKYMFRSCALTSLDSIKDWVTSKVTDMSYMFDYCTSLTSVDLSSWDTSKVKDMRQMFSNCSSLTSIDLSSWDTSKVTDMSSMFNYCSKLKSISSINCSGISSKNYYPLYSNSTVTDVGGFIGMKMSWDNNYGLAKCSNLTYESCINILNGLYDFTGNGVTPTSSQGTLKVNAKFLTTVGDEISIGTNKGWKITS